MPKQTAPPPTSNYDDYREAIRSQDLDRPPAEWTFKHQAGYRHILEHVAPAEGQAFFRQAVAEGWWNEVADDFRDLAARNDSVGQPQQVDYPEAEVTCSPTNWRYLYHAMRVRAHMRTLSPQHVIELGGGYGGLALFLHRLVPQVRAYTLVDLPEAIELQAAYAEAMGLDVDVANGLDGDALGDVVVGGYPHLGNYFLSAYGFSEFDPAMQQWYADQLIPWCPHGFVVWNYAPYWPQRPPNPVEGAAEYFTRPLTIVPEDPPISPDRSYFITY